METPTPKVKEKSLITATIIVDTRESKPYEFKLKGPSGFKIDNLIQQGLKAGDYSLLNYTDPDSGPSIMVERKQSLEEFLGNIGKNWERFQRELDRLRVFDVAQIVIEDDLRTAYGRYKKTKFFNFPPEYIIKKMAEIELEYGISTILVSNRTYGQKYLMNLFKYFLIKHGPKD